MISYLKGTILNKGQGYIILLVGDIGYKVFINQTRCSTLTIGQQLELYIHQHIKEDASDLYGFNNLEELEMFELLLSISGIGPKSASGVLAIADVTEIKEYIAQGDPSLLMKVSGIGKKTAERVVLELRDKIIKLGVGGSSKTDKNIMASGDEIDALTALGYTLQQAREALKQVNPEVKDSGERIRQALKKLG